MSADAAHADDQPGDGAGAKQKVPGLYRNWISFAGTSIAFASLAAIIFLFLAEMTAGAHDNPYTGIFTYILFPSVLAAGLALVVLGMLVERRRRRRLAPGEVPRYPTLDLNDPRRRRSFIAFVAFTFLFVMLSAVGSYRAFEHTESVQFCGQTCHTVMKPEFTAYQASPHARVKCVECHVGPGADWYVRSKISGAYQLYSVAFNKFPRPIKTPVHNLRPAQDTCEQCHWPAKFFGAQLKVFSRYAYDERNTKRETRMLINTGGGDPATGQVAGIHWHMNIANEITYVSKDDQRQEIPWVRVKDPQGRVTEYVAEGSGLSPQQIAAMPQRKMDCVDCHNRPSHIYVPPDRAINDSLDAGRLDPSLPYIKRQAVDALTRDYATTEEAMAGISSTLQNFYRAQYPEVLVAKADSVRAAVAEVQRVYQTYIFPEMKTDWRTHPDNIGHFYDTGCFRCHNGKLKSPATGLVISSDCNVCHTVLDQSDGGRPIAVENGSFKHFVDLGSHSSKSCVECHRANAPFRHPVNLGDISQFQCAECHKKQ